MQATCKHCQRAITRTADGIWIDPEAMGDDAIWRETCDAHDTFTAEHEPIRCECGNVATDGAQCEWCASPECEIIVEVIGTASGERIGTCGVDGRPVFQSRITGTIYHATEDR